MKTRFADFQKVGLFKSALSLPALLIFVLSFLPFVAVQAHTPYGQWDAFRLRHLQVLTSHADLAGDAIADVWVAELTEHLPKSRAVVSRARNLVRVASLLKTDQAKLAVLSHAHAKAMLTGASPFDEIGAIPIQVLLDNGTHVLISRDDLPLEHGYLITATLFEQASRLNLSIPAEDQFDIAVHPGAVAVSRGESLPQ